jgi:uncharacterized protein YcbK (DUF882 family)
MKLDLNTKITPNFNLSEVVNSIQDQKARQLSFEALNAETLIEAVKIAMHLQGFRDDVNDEFGGGRSIQITSWLRAKEWELLRGRSGKSMHVTGNAVDFRVMHKGVIDQEVTRWLWNRIWDWNGGRAKLEVKGEIRFIHVDLGTKRRWDY